MKRPISYYFTEGFRLTNKSFVLLLISILLMIPTRLPESFPKTNFFGIEILFYVFIVGFSFSLPIFQKRILNREKINYREVISITLKNTKKIVLPFIGLLVLAIGVMIVMGGFLILYYQLNNLSVDKMWTSISDPAYLIMLLGIAIISLLFTFTAPFFSLHNYGVFQSLKKSAEFSTKHVSIVVLITVIVIGQFTLYTSTAQSFWVVRVLVALLYEYITILGASIALVYFLDHYKGSSK